MPDSPTRCRRCPGASRRRGLCQKHYRAYLSSVSRDRGWVPAAATASHLAVLSSAGIGVPQVSRLCGVPAATLSRIALQGEVHATTEAAVLSVPVDPLRLAADNAHIDSTGTCRRLRALIAMGHTKHRIGVSLRYTGGRLVDLIEDRRDTITAGVARRVAAMYEEWSAAVGTSTAAREHAARRGWDTPFAWDGLDIDDPCVSADPGTDSADDFGDRVDDARSAGWSDDRIAESLGIKPDSLKRKLSRLRAV